jgi:hypothetical protein
VIREWRNLRLWELVLMVTFPVAALAAVAAVLLPGWSYQYDAALVVLAVVGGIVVIAFVRVVGFRCPRCGKLYSVRVGPGRFPGRRVSSRNCLHCWLPKWADPAEVPDDDWPGAPDEDW